MFVRIVLLAIAAAFLGGCGTNDSSKKASEQEIYGWLIRGALVLDGSGSEGFLADLRIRDGRITELGELQPEPSERVWLAEGLTLAPGFIDPHSHHADALAPAAAYPSVLAQGITTVIGGADGESDSATHRRFLRSFEAAPAAFNLAYFGGHNTYRTAVNG